MSTEFQIEREEPQPDVQQNAVPEKKKRRPPVFPNRNGRPRRTFDTLKFEALAHSACSQAEMASYFGCSTKTIERLCKIEPYRTIYQDAMAGCRAILRSVQYQKAREGNVPMLIWLGKQLLGQRDKTESVVITVELLNEQIEAKRKKLRELGYEFEQQGSSAIIEGTARLAVSEGQPAIPEQC